MSRGRFIKNKKVLAILIAVLIAALGVAIYFIVRSVIYAVRAVIAFVKANIAVINTVIAVIIGLAIASLFAFVVIKLLLRRVKGTVREHSAAIKQLNALGEKYPFYAIPDLDMEHSYDNDKYYDNITPTDYLTYQLVHSDRVAHEAIKLARSNARSYPRYLDEVEGIDCFGQFDVKIPALFRRYALRRERELFDSLIKKAIVEFRINVELNLTTLKGYYLKGKSELFSSEQIESLLKRISHKRNGYYLDQGVWESISRVERGKVSNKLRFAVYKRDGNKCVRCGATEGLEVDHIFPVSRGGKTEIDNLQTLCHNCNTSKANNVEEGAIDPRHTKKKRICPNCNTDLVLKNGRFGNFYACPNYPSCKYTQRI